MTIQRITARVLPVNQDGAVLLLEEQDPAHPGDLYWSSIGGAADPGESLLEAALRELGEEAGIDVDPDRVVGPVHRHEQAYSWAGVDYLGDHTYFAVPLDRAVEVSFDRLEPEEIGNVLSADWWTPDGLADTGSFRPPTLPEIMRTAIDAIEARR